MSRILVLYGTTEGHTAKVARVMTDVLRALALDVDLVDAGPSNPDPAGYAGVIVAASVHAGGYQKSVERWVRKHATQLQDKPTAFVSVCLGVLQHDPAVDAELASIILKFLEATGWRPTDQKIVAGALAYTQYNLVKRWVMRRIAKKAGGDIDTSRDYEYTDWADVKAFAREFAARLGDPPAEARVA